jgi:formylglycine-generating enzyme required for sulfatase activity/alpha-tubulin suppressor-like RCC1 family protein
MKHLLALFFGLLAYASAAFGQVLTITTNSTLPPAYSGETLSPIQLDATGGTAPYTWTLVTGLPALVGKIAPGLSVNPTGQIVGTPTALQAPVGFTIQVADSSSPKKITKKVFAIAVISTTPKLAIAPIPPAFLGSNYSWTFNATEGKTPYTWSTNSTLPQGLSLNATTGILGGMVSTSQALGNFTLAIAVTGSNDKSASGNFVLSVLPAFAWGTDSVLPGGKAGTSYSQNLMVSGGKPPYSFVTKNGSVPPPGLTLNATTKRISGTPTASGNFSFTITAKDAASPTNTLDRTFTLAIESYGMIVNGTSTISGKQYTAITPAPFTVSGGMGPYKWSTTPALPAALTINATTGVISGNLTAALGNYTVAVTVKDKGNQTASRNCTITVQEADPFAWVTPETLPGGKVATVYSQNLTVSGGKPPYTFASKNGSAPPVWLTLNATTGRLAGTPTASGNFSFTITAKDAASSANTLDRTFTLAIESYGMSVNGTSVINGKQYTAITPAPFTVSGGMGPYKWSATPALPAALTINATTGVISGNLTAAPGNYTVAVTVKDKGNQTASRNCTITVQEPAPLAWVTDSVLPGGQIGTAYSQNLTVSGGRAPYTFVSKNGSNLPTWLTLNRTTGRLAGTPAAPGNFSLTILAKDSTNPESPSIERIFTIQINSKLAITTNRDLGALSLGQSKSFTINATGGQAPYIWELVTEGTPANFVGRLPNGLNISPEGILQGIPTQVGVFGFNVKVTDSSNPPQFYSTFKPIAKNPDLFQIQVVPNPPGPVVVKLPIAIIGGEYPQSGGNYTFKFNANGGVAPILWSWSSSEPLPWLNLNSATGELRGIPVEQSGAIYPKDVQLQMTATGNNSMSGSANYTLTIVKRLALTGPLKISGYQGTSILTNTTYTASGGKTAYAFSWNASSGNQSILSQTGLSLNSTTGRLSGNLSGSIGTYNVLAKVTDNSTQNATMTTQVRILARPTLSIATPSRLGTVDTVVTNSLRLRATPRSPAVGGNYTWSLLGPVVKTPSTANVTVTVSSSGILSYRAPSRCSANFTVRVQDRLGSFTTKNFTVSFRNPKDLYIQTRWLPTSYIGYPYSAGISTINGKDPISWSVIAGSLGPEFELIPQNNGRQAIIRWKGALPPSASITKTFTLRASDSSPIKQVDECDYVLSIIPVPPPQPPPPPPPPPAPKPKLFDRIQSNLPLGKILAVDDWNGDGLNDVFLRSRNPESGEDQSALYTNRGGFSFLSAAALPVEARSAVKLFVEDFDNDGLSDLLSVDAQLRAFLNINSGEGSFETTELAGLFVGDLATIDPENDLSCSDIDADGDIDLIAAVRNSSGGHVVALWNRADDEGVFPALFSGKSYLIKSTAQYPKFSVVSVDSNPKPDLLVLLSEENSSSNVPAVLYLNSGNVSADYANSNNATSCAAFSTPTQTAIIGSPDGSFVSADIDSDGDMDLIAPASLNENSSTLDAPRFFLNQGNNTFTGGNAPVLDPALQHRGLAAFDADLDGAIDLIWTEVSGIGALYPRLWKNTWAANSAFTDITELADTGLATAPASEIEMAATGFSADLDGDRDPDFLFTASSAEGGLESDPASFAVFRNNSESRGARWINTQLIGVFSPSRGTGAKVVLQRDADIVDGNGTLVTSKPKFAQIIGPDTGNRAKNNLIFGLAGKGSADRVSVDWTSGLSTSLANALSNPFYWPPHRPPVYRFLRLPETDALPPQRPIRQGRVIPWGAAPAGSQTAFTANLTDSVAISAGGTHSLSLAANGTVKAWGGNASGQTAIPPKLVDIVQISAGGSHNLALRSNGRITAWGANEFGQSTVPPPLRYAKYIAAGRDFSLAIDGISNVVAWGNNSTGQCAPPPDLGPVNAVAGGGEHALALLADGTLAGWGSNSSSQLDVPPANGAKFTQIAAGANHNLALTENGRVIAWGANGAGQSTVPAEALQDISQISANGNQSIALRSDGTIITWGEGYQNAHLKPVASNIVAISAGPAHALALKALSSGYDPRDFVDVQGGRFPNNESLPEDVPLFLFPGEQVNSFRIGKYEVTRGEWLEVTRWAIYNGYRYFTEGAGGQGQYTHPAYDLSWFDAIAWCNAKSEINGLTPVYKLNGQTYKGSGASDPAQIQLIAGATGFRLPTEIQWEWAARGGNQTKNSQFSGSNNLDEVAIYEENSVNASPRLEGTRGAFPVGSKLPNELGIHDMSGNVWEHCFALAEVPFEDELTGNLTTSNGTISRGGSWLNSEVSCGFTDLAVNSQLPGYVINTIGFRLALLAEPEIVVPNNAVEIQPSGSPQTYEFVVRDPGTTNSPWGNYNWNIEGNLPPGIGHSGFLNGNRLVLSGTPTKAGWYDIILQVETDGHLVRKPVTLKFTPTGTEFSEMVTVQGGTLPESSQLSGQAVQTFQIGKYEITWGEWKAVRTWAVANGYSDLANVGEGSADNHPVRDVSWYDTVKWLNAKSQMEDLVSVYSVNGTTYKTGQSIPTLLASANGYRLPAEAEWEWAARGGVSSKGYTYSGSNDANAVAWYDQNSGNGTKAIGAKAPNELGICDMSGNVWEWCEDVANDSRRRQRGGGWANYLDAAAVANRGGFYSPDVRADGNGAFGFRVARNAEVFDRTVPITTGIADGTAPYTLGGLTVSGFIAGGSFCWYLLNTSGAPTPRNYFFMDGAGTIFAQITVSYTIINARIRYTHTNGDCYEGFLTLTSPSINTLTRIP